MRTKITKPAKKGSTNGTTDSLELKLNVLLDSYPVRKNLILKTKVELAISMLPFNSESSKKTLEEVRSLIAKPTDEIRRATLQDCDLIGSKKNGKRGPLTHEDILHMAEAKRRSFKS